MRRITAAVAACVLTAAATAAQPAAATAAQPQVLELGNSWKIESQILGETRTLMVSPPADYDPTLGGAPVLWVTDAPAHFVHTVGTVDFLRRQGRMPGMIVVGVVNTDRTRDLTPTNAKIGDNEFPTSGGADRFLRFLVEEARPFLEERYATRPFHVFAGHSFGGLFSLWTYLTHPDAFDAYIAVSPSTHWDDELPLRLARWAFTEGTAAPTTLFLSLGGEPVLEPSFDRFEQLLAENAPPGLDWEVRHFPDEDHGSVVLRSHYFGLKKVFAGWSFVPPAPTAEAPGGTAAAIEEHYAALSTRMGWQVAPREDLVNQLGYRSLGRGAVDDAIAVFALNLRHYPDSANVYDSYGEALEAKGDLVAAEANYRRATELATAGLAPAATYQANLERVRQLLAGQASATP